MLPAQVLADTQSFSGKPLDQNLSQQILAR